MQTIRLMIGLGFLTFAAYIAYYMVEQYRQSSATGLARLWDAAHGSATKLWAKFVIIVAGITANLDGLADLLGAPELKTAIDAYVGNPKVVAGVMLVVSLVSIKARNRTA
tara:strand:- start:316 stop:645 length:330 start_codon:yes stop_codon:yes gene_type:complete